MVIVVGLSHSNNQALMLQAVFLHVVRIVVLPFSCSTQTVFHRLPGCLDFFVSAFCSSFLFLFLRLLALLLPAKPPM